MNRRERRVAAKNAKARRNTPGANAAAALYEAALSQMQAGRHLEAQLCCQQALALDPDHADTLHLMGRLSFQAKQYDHAFEWITRAIRREPNPAYLASLGSTLLNQGRREEAVAVFDKAVQLKPDDAESSKILAEVLVDLNRLDQALRAFQHVLKLHPRDWDATKNSAFILLQLGRVEEAISCLDVCDQVSPDHASTLQLRAIALHQLNRVEDGVAFLRRAHELDPENAEICNNLGVFLRKLGLGEEAVVWFDRAIERKPDFCAAYTGKAFALSRLHRFAEAFAVYETLLALNPGNVEASWSLSLLQLLTGNFEAGWSGREVRFKVPNLPVSRFQFSQPLWLGKEPVAGKTILIHVDEGIGDTIQFARYVPMVAALGARVILLVADSLCPLLSGLAGVSECLPLSAERTIAFDFYCPISSLPLAFGTRLETIPSATPYLPAPEPSRLQAWEERLGPHDKLRVGLVWSGNPKHGDDRNRSLPLRALLPLFDCNATFVSLQKDPRSDDQATLRERPDIIDLTEHLTDFAATAALVSCLDIVITVDTSVAHLAGAMGRQTWILLPYTPDYRWLLDRDDSPWYPTARLFRQTETRDYAEVLERVRDVLFTQIAAFRPEVAS